MPNKTNVILSELHETHSTDECVKVLEWVFGSRSLEAAVLIRSQVNLYDGSLGKRWRYWNHIVSSLSHKNPNANNVTKTIEFLEVSFNPNLNK